MKITFFNKQLTMACDRAANSLLECLTTGTGTTTNRCMQCNDQYLSFRLKCSQEIAKNIASNAICEMKTNKACYDHIFMTSGTYYRLVPFNCENSCHVKYALFWRHLQGYSGFDTLGWKETDVKSCIGETCIT